MHRIDLDESVVWTDVGPIGLTPTEVALMRCLLDASGVAALAAAEHAYDTAHRLLTALGDAAMLATLEVYRLDIDLWRGRARRVIRRLRAVLDSGHLTPGLRDDVCRTSRC